MLPVPLKEAVIGKVECVREFEDTHRPATNLPGPPFDGLPKIFERDDAPWSDNACSVVVPTEDSTIRVAWGRGQRVFPTKGE
jgi:hypothetical protein